MKFNCRGLVALVIGTALFGCVPPPKQGDTIPTPGYYHLGDDVLCIEGYQYFVYGHSLAPLFELGAYGISTVKQCRPAPAPVE